MIQQQGKRSTGNSWMVLKIPTMQNSREPLCYPMLVDYTDPRQCISAWWVRDVRQPPTLGPNGKMYGCGSKNCLPNKEVFATIFGFFLDLGKGGRSGRDPPTPRFVQWFGQ